MQKDYTLKNKVADQPVNEVEIKKHNHVADLFASLLAKNENSEVARQYAISL